MRACVLLLFRARSINLGTSKAPPFAQPLALT